MCGIAGIINNHHIDVHKLLLALKHRGPDDQTIYRHNQVVLLHTRLAIQDIQNGQQPFHFGDYSIVFNGEIYNHLELRAKLANFTFQTNADTETLLYLFIKYQYKMFDLIDGMYALCIFDKKNNKLILARDRAGKKPLYYFQDDNNFIFASELNAIKAVKDLEIDSDSIHCYLRTGLIWRPNTAYRHVYKLEPASYLILNVDTLQSEQHKHFDMLHYYQNNSQTPSTLQDVLQQTESCLKKSIANRITASDVEVGVFLSGGIDSNLIAAMASHIKPNIKTFTVKFDGVYDESFLAKLTAEKYQTHHIELNISNDLKNDVEKILLSYGEPFMDSSAIPSYYVAKEASKYVKVILSGDGADELFAGYRRYVPAAYNLMKYVKFISPLVNYFPKPHTKQSYYNYFHRLTAMANKQGLDFYLSATSDVFEDVWTFLPNKITNDLGEFITNVSKNRSLSTLKKMLYTDFSVILFCDLLVKMDIASMAHSLEVRSPFLSKYLLELAPGLPDKYKINRFKTKYILRKLAEQYLPSEIVNQPKRGFEVPLKKWVDDELRDGIHDHLSAGCYAENYMNKKFIHDLLAKKIDVSAEKRAKMLWSLYCLETWYRNEKNRIYC